MEPVQPVRGAGRIILLNGASSSGKSTLAKKMQAALDEPFLCISSDLFTGVLPQRREIGGPFDWWQEMRPRFFSGFQHCLPALAHAGNDLIVDHIIEFPAWRRDLAIVLAGLDVYLIGVHCDLEEIDRRERERGDRRIGEGCTHVAVDGIHTFGPYDLEVDTTTGVTEELVNSTIDAWRHRPPDRAL